MTNKNIKVIEFFSYLQFYILAMLKKYPLQFTLTLVLFLLINTAHFWGGDFGIFAFPIFFLLFILFFLLLIELLRQIYISIRDKFGDKSRNYLLAFMTLCIILIIAKPTGIINFDKLEGENLYFAQSEGAANCTSTLKLKKSDKFIYESVCFGFDKTKGNYEIKKDSIFFRNFDKRKFQFEFGKIDKKGNNIILYRKKNDKNPYSIPIINN